MGSKKESPSSSPRRGEIEKRIKCDSIKKAG
jgi:hypothetical protein